MTNGFDHDLNNVLCLNLEAAGVFDRFIRLCEKYRSNKAGRGPILTASRLSSIMKNYITPVVSIARFKVVEVGREDMGDWTWFGVIVIQFGSILELMFEGNNGKVVVGSSLLDLRSTVLQLRSAPGSGPPYIRPDYDGDDERLERLAAEIAALVTLMKDVVRKTPLT